MSRHIKAQATPTHASGFQLFTVAMTGHAEKWFQLPQQKVAVLNRCCPNAVKGAGAREWDLSRCLRGFACLIDPRRSTAPQTGTRDTFQSRTYREGTVPAINKQPYATI